MRSFAIPSWFFACVIGAAALVAASCATPDPQVVRQQHLDAGNARFAHKEFREALVEYRRSIQADPSFGPAHRRAADAYTALDDPDGARAEYLRAADLAPGDNQIQVEVGNLLLYAGRFQDAEGRARGVLRRDPKSAAALLLLGSALAGLKRADAAFDVQQQALVLNPRDAGLHVKMGALQFLRGNREEALAALQQASALDGRSAPIKMALASYYWSVGNAGEVELLLKAALASEPDSVLANGALATVYLETDRGAEAEPLLKKVVALASGASARVSSRVALSTFYLQQRRHAEAEKVLEPLLAERDTFPIAKTRLAQIAFDAKRHDAAAAALAEVLAREPGYVPALALQTHVFLHKGATGQALASARTAVEVNPRSAISQYALGRAYLANNHIDQARDAFLETIKLDPRSTNAYRELSRIRFGQGEIDLAVRRAETAVALSPRSLEARLLLARALIARPETAPRAKTQLRQLATDFPDSPRPHLMSGTLALLEKDEAGASRAFDRAAALDSSSFEAVNGLVSIDLRTKHVERALSRLELFLAAHPVSIEALMMLAQVHAMQHDNARAEEALRRIVQLQPANLDAYTALGTLYIAQNKVREAREEFIRIAEREPGSVGPPTLVGVLSQSLSEPIEAERWYKKALEIDANAPVAANNLAWIYAEQGRHLDVAVQLAKEANTRLPGRPEVSDTLGWASYKAELTSTAIPLFQKSIAGNPSNPTYHYHLGMAYTKQRDVERARASLQRALTLNPSFAHAPDARAALASLD